MSRSDLKNWPVFSLLDPEFIATIRLVVVYGNLGNEALIVTKDDMVYALGSNTTGCLGTGDSHSTLLPKKVEALCDKGVKSFAYGSGPHVLALTNGGEVYSWGHNGYFELGNGTSNQGLTPAIVGTHLSGKMVIKIACGSHHSLALTDEGEVYAWGQNNCGQVGSGISSHQAAPRKVNSLLSGKKVVSIVCGQTSSMAVTDVGEVFGWGHNGVGQLGLGNCVNQPNPSKVTALASIVIEKVVCGYAHTLALSDEGALYVWGGNSYGQLGLGNKTNASSPTRVTVTEMGRISDIAAVHYNHISVAMGDGNVIYMWGQCRGQSVTSPTPTRLAHPHDALAFYASPSVMYEPLLLHGEEETGILDCLKQAFDDTTTSDLIIQVQGKPIHVHKSVLKIRCQHFRSMFQEHWAEDSQNILQLDQFSHAVYKSFLRYLYTDEVDLPAENALELLDLANAYCEPQLKRRCVQMIKQGITVENAAFLFSTAISYNAQPRIGNKKSETITFQELEEFCFKFALNHMTAVIQTASFANLEESTVKSFVIKAARVGAFKT